MSKVCSARFNCYAEYAGFAIPTYKYTYKGAFSINRDISVQQKSFCILCQHQVF